MLEFKVLKKATDCNARLGEITTPPHGVIETPPIFMPVGTRGGL